VQIALLHALPLDERMWEQQRDALAGHDVVAPRLYGLGQTMDEWAAAVLEQVRGPFVPVGASMGGYCALAIAARAPERLRGLVLAGSRADADPPERRAAREESIATIRAGGAAALWEDMRQRLFSPSADLTVVGRAQEIALEQSPAGLEAAVGAIRDRADLRGVVASLEPPVLVAAGDSDPFLPVEEARALADSAPAGTLALFEGVGHLPNLEHPSQFNLALVDFLDSLP